MSKSAQNSAANDSIPATVKSATLANINTKYFIDRLVDEAESSPKWQALKAEGEAAIAKNGKKTGLEKLASHQVSGILYVSPALLAVDPGFNERDLNTKEASDKLIELARSIKGSGVQQVMVLKKDADAYTFEDGHRRFYATMYAVVHLGADLKTVPVRMGAKHASDADRVFSQYLLNSGEKPTPFEQASIFARMLRLGWSEADLIERSGLSKSRVTQLLDMNTVPAEVKALSRQDIVVKPSFIFDRFLANKRDAAATIEELTAAIQNAKEGGYDRATPKHLPETAAEGQSHRRANAKAPEATQENRQAPTIQPGTPANVAPPSADTAGSTAPETTRTAAPQTAANKSLRAVAQDFFRNYIEVEEYERGTDKPIKFKIKDGKDAFTEEFWKTIRDGYDI